MISTALSFLRQAADSITAVFKLVAWGLGMAMNGIIGAFNLFINAFNFLFGWLTGSIPSIPYITLPKLGSGAIAMEPTPVIVGDVPEAIIPLNQLAGMLSMQPAAAGMTGFGGFGGGGGIGGNGATININLSQDRLAQIMLRQMTSANVNDNGVGFAPIRVG